MKALLVTLIMFVLIYKVGNWLNTHYIHQEVRKDTIIESKHIVTAESFIEIQIKSKALPIMIDSLNHQNITKK